MTLCGSVHGYLGPRKGLRLVTCTLPRVHEPYDQHCHEPLMMRWEGPLLLWDEFEHTRPKRKEAGYKLVRLARQCQKCGKLWKGGQPNCECYFQSMTLNKKYWEDLAWLDAFIAQHKEILDAEFPPYFGEF